MQNKWKSYDVIVCGAGVAGISAAVAAGRAGASVLLIEKNCAIGGTATLGLNCSFEGVDTKLMGGIFSEMIEKLKERNAIIMGAYAPFSITDFQDVCLEMLYAADVTILFDTVFEKFDEDGGLYLRTKNGTLLVKAHAYVDATGDGDLAVAAGADFEMGDPENQEIQPVSQLFRMGNVDIQRVLDYIAQKDQFYKEKLLFVCDVSQDPPLLIGNGFFDWVEQQKKKGLRLGREAIAIIKTPNPGEVLINATRLSGINALDPIELSNAMREMTLQTRSLQKHLKETMPGFENAYVIDYAPMLGVRETRRIVGRYQLTQQDIEQGRRFPDAIASNFFPIDIHGPQSNPGGYAWILPGGDGVYDVPLRCIIPAKVDGVFVAGRCISSSHSAHGSTRTMPCCIATGQAAGICAALYLDGEEESSFSKRVRAELLRQQVPLDSN